jgi:hypothetical protein
MRDLFRITIMIAPAAIVVGFLVLPTLWRWRLRRRAIRNIKPYLGDCIPPGTDEDHATFARHEAWRHEIGRGF